MIDLQTFAKDGFAVTAPLLSREELQSLIALIESCPHDASPREARRGGVRDVMDRVPQLRAVADDPRVRRVVQQILGAEAFPVRATLFDKTPEANWKVPWHQDVTIAVEERLDTMGYGPWSIKEGVQHVQPPAEVLERMVSVRVHLDPCPAENGALRVQPGTHLLGKLNQSKVDGHVNVPDAICCEAAAGEALVMRPLLLHASSPSASPMHRRVLHFDFAVGELPDGLQWKMRIPTKAEA